MATLPAGVFPTMITPFVPDGSAIDWVVLDKLVDWYIASGVTGLFACCLSSEMYELSADERVELARRVKQRAAGRCGHWAAQRSKLPGDRCNTRAGAKPTVDKATIQKRDGGHARIHVRVRACACSEGCCAHQAGGESHCARALDILT